MNKNKELGGLIPRKIEYKGDDFLGIPTGIVGKSFSLTKIIQMKNNPGWLVKGKSIKEWKIKGFCKIGDEIFLYGPHIEGKSLEEILSTQVNQFLPIFYTLISSLIVLQQHSIPLFRIATHSVFFLNDGSILFLPPEIQKELIDLSPVKDKIRVFSVCNHPDRPLEENLSFSLGVFLYKVITGNYPYFSENEEELHHMIRELSITSPRIVQPGLKNTVVNITLSSLEISGKNIPSLKTWQDSVKTWIDDGIETEISETEKLLVKETEKQKKEKAVKRFRFKVFLNKNFVKIAVISGVILCVGVIAGLTIKNMFFRTRVTAGLSPYEVVRTYYKSINGLDYFALSDCIINDAGKSELQTVMNLYVMTRQRSMYDQSVNFISAQDWDDNGRPPLEPYIPMYGVINVEIRKEEYESEPVYITSYEKWFVETETTGQVYSEGKVIYHGSFIKERLSLKQDRNVWVIYSIEVLEKRDISPGASE